MKPLEQASFQNYQSRQLELMPLDQWDIDFKPGLRRQAGEAIKALRGESHELADLEAGLRTMLITERIYEQ